MKTQRFSLPVCLVTVILLALFVTANAQTFIEIKTPMAPPEWALLERALLDENERFVHYFADKYINPITGHLECVVRWGGADGPDDAMENFNKWSLLYALGAPKSTLDLFNFIWNGHIDQYTKAKHPITGEGMLYREFITSFDWEHTGEGMAAFLLLPLSDPEDWRTQERIVRFANFYTGRDSTSYNYDPENKIIRSAFNGSKGPMFNVTNEDWFGHNVEAVETRKEIMKEFRNVKGDIPFNLCVTSLAANAYLMTGDEHYKNWVLEYAGAWRQRTIKNNGMIPSNVGINGIVGEHWDGKWYGGLFGWNFGDLGGFNMIRRGMRIGFNNAYLLSGDPGFLEILRQQGDILLENRKKTDEGLMPPNKYGDDGWYDYSRNDVSGHFTDLYIMTLEDHDIERLYDAAQGRVDPWIEFLQGKNPDHPVNALNQELKGIRSRSANIRNDSSTPDTRDSDDTQRFSSAGISHPCKPEMGRVSSQ